MKGDEGDFGELLDEWERRSSRPMGGSPDVESFSRKFERYLDSSGVEDKDATDGAEREEEDRRRKARREAMERAPVDATIDLHGLTLREAEAVLRRFLVDCAGRGLEKALVVHGKGLHSKDGPVLKDMARRLVGSSHLVEAYGAADRRSGGGGALWIWIRAGITSRGK